MKRLGKIMFSIILTILLFGCSSFSSISGTYVDKNNSKQYLELNSDGTFFWQQTSGAFSGNYKVESGKITWSVATGQSARGTIQGNTIIDDEGEPWIKK